MATNKLKCSVDEKTLECNICLKRLENAKSLSCVHSFCLACLEDWVKTRGKLVCPTCMTVHSIPNGGLHNLPPNIYLNSILENAQKLPKIDEMKCVCEHTKAKYYCQDCRCYLCSTCRDHHISVLANHKLLTVENVQSMTSQELVQPLLCLKHSKPLEFYCIHCKIPICEQCVDTEHIKDVEEHQTIRIPHAFQQFKKTAIELKEAANEFTENIKKDLKRVFQNDTKLEKSKVTSLSDIDNIVQEMIIKIKENGDEMKNKVETIYQQKKRSSNMQTDELKTRISDVETQVSVLDQLLKSDKTTAMKSSDMVIKELENKLEEQASRTEPENVGKIDFIKNISSLQWKCNIGDVIKTRADCLKLMGGEDVTQSQPIVLTVIKTIECEIDVKDLMATWTCPTGETKTIQVEKDESGNYTVTGKCLIPGVCALDVSVDGEPIKESPMTIKIHKEGPAKTIKIHKEIVSDVVLYDDNSFLVSCQTRDILKYTQSGDLDEKTTLPEGVKVNRMYKMKNGDIVFSDCGNKCITLLNKMNSQVIKSIGKGVLKNPMGIHVDESLNVVYVADWGSSYVFDIDSSQMIRKIPTWRGVPDVTLTKEGNPFLLFNQHDLSIYMSNLRKQCIVRLLDKKGNRIDEIVRANKMWNPRGIIVDADDNIIISSEHKVGLYTNDGNFIKLIGEKDGGIQNPWGLSVANYPRRVAVANKGNATIQIYNY